jgi:hypothetical protein
MTDRQKIYTKVVKTLKEMMEMSHQGHLVTLAMMITGIVLSRNAQLSLISSEVPVAAKDKSIEMRLRRWVKHGKIDADVIYMPFARQILAALATAPLILVMDGSQAGRGCMMVLMLAYCIKNAPCQSPGSYTRARKYNRSTAYSSA